MDNKFLHLVKPKASTSFGDPEINEESLPSEQNPPDPALKWHPFQEEDPETLIYIHKTHGEPSMQHPLQEPDGDVDISTALVETETTPLHHEMEDQLYQVSFTSQSDSLTPPEIDASSEASHSSPDSNEENSWSQSESNLGSPLVFNPGEEPFVPERLI